MLRSERSDCGVLAGTARRSVEVAPGELGAQLLPDERRGFDVTERAARQIEAVPEVAGQRAQRLPRQIRIQPASDGVHAHRVDREGCFGFEARGPIAQERELEA